MQAWSVRRYGSPRAANLVAVGLAFVVVGPVTLAVYGQPASSVPQIVVGVVLVTIVEAVGLRRRRAARRS